MNTRKTILLKDILFKDKTKRVTERDCGIMLYGEERPI